MHIDCSLITVMHQNFDNTAHYLPTGMLLIDEDGKVKLIDFDWAGRYDMRIEDKGVPEDLQAIISSKAGAIGTVEESMIARYPVGLSEKIRWAEGVKELSAIRPGLDWAMLNLYPTI